MALSGIPTKAMNYLTDRYVVVEEIRKTMLLVLLYTDFFFRLQSLFFRYRYYISNGGKPADKNQLYNCNTY